MSGRWNASPPVIDKNPTADIDRAIRSYSSNVSAGCVSSRSFHSSLNQQWLHFIQHCELTKRMMYCGVRNSRAAASVAAL